MRLTESSIYFKTRLSDLSFENEFYLHENKKNHFHISGFVLSLALKQRFETALKWLFIGSVLACAKNNSAVLEDW